MNTLIIDKEMMLENYSGNIKITKDVKLLIKGTCKIYEIIDDDGYDLDITINDNANLEYNRFCLAKNSSKVSINQCDGSVLKYNESILGLSDYKLKLDVYINGSQINSDTNINVLAKKGSKVEVAANGIIVKGTKENVINEALKGFNVNNGQTLFYPNLIVDSYHVSASHNATIKNVDKNEIFYLQSKGLKKETALKLLEESFLLNIFSNDFRDVIRKYL